VADKSSQLLEICREHGILACYLFGSRADDGKAVLEGPSAIEGGSDLDVGVLFASGDLPNHRTLSSLQIALEDLFAPLRVDLVPLDRVDPLFQFAAISRHRVAALDPSRADRTELRVMRAAAELLPIQRRLERDQFGVESQ
jgi:predicted nucleotidyltransferase